MLKNIFTVLVFSGLVLSPLYACQSDSEASCSQAELNESRENQESSESQSTRFSDSEEKNLGMLIRLEEADPRGDGSY